jgi:hypothetical protein
MNTQAPTTTGLVLSVRQKTYAKLEQNHHAAQQLQGYFPLARQLRHPAATE